ncbi:MAG TPA: hypothetical protein VFC45_10470 [Pseudolabrys sp.]|nr:hypothetical protein [Pseudolabrys sp.]
MATLLCGLANPAISYGANPVRGELRIYKQMDYLNTDYSKSVVVPSGAEFRDVGPIDHVVLKEDWWPLIIVTMKRVTLSVKNECKNVPATISAKSKIETVSPQDKRLLEFFGQEDESGPVPDRMDPWAKSPPILVTLGKEFKQRQCSIKS